MAANDAKLLQNATAQKEDPKPQLLAMILHVYSTRVLAEGRERG
jgi:hypothetical protein